MASTDIKTRVIAKEWGLLEESGALLPGMATDLDQLTAHAEAEVRDLALSGLNKLGGPLARRAILGALRDSDVAVRSRASLFLHHHRDPSDVGVLHAELLANSDEFVREHVALVIGELGEARSIEVLRHQLPIEPDEYVRSSIELALAKLGDKGGESALLDRLSDESARVRAEALRDFQWVNNRKLIAALRPLLGDTRDAVNVGLSHSPDYIRVCDVAVNVLDALLNHSFQFQVSATRRYTAAELAEAKQKLFGK